MPTPAAPPPALPTASVLMNGNTIPVYASQVKYSLTQYFIYMKALGELLSCCRSHGQSFFTCYAEGPNYKRCISMTTSSRENLYAWKRESGNFWLSVAFVCVPVMQFFWRRFFWLGLSELPAGADLHNYYPSVVRLEIGLRLTLNAHVFVDNCEAVKCLCRCCSLCWLFAADVLDTTILLHDTCCYKMTKRVQKCLFKHSV